MGRRLSTAEQEKVDDVSQGTIYPAEQQQQQRISSTCQILSTSTRSLSVVDPNGRQGPAAIREGQSVSQLMFRAVHRQQG